MTPAAPGTYVQRHTCDQRSCRQSLHPVCQRAAMKIPVPKDSPIQRIATRFGWAPPPEIRSRSLDRDKVQAPGTRVNSDTLVRSGPGRKSRRSEFHSPVAGLQYRSIASCESTRVGGISLPKSSNNLYPASPGFLNKPAQKPSPEGAACGTRNHSFMRNARSPAFSSA